MSNQQVIIDLEHFVKDRFVAMTTIHPDLIDIRVSAEARFALDEIVVRAMVDVITRDHEVATYPSDWGQDLKQRWLPAWVQRRWRVRYTSVTAKTFCPHLVGDKRTDHTNFVRALPETEHSEV